MYLFGFLVLTQALSIVISFDIEVQGVVRLGEDFYNGLGKGAGPNGLGSHQNQKRHEIFVRTKQKLSKKISRSSIMRATSVANNRTDEIMQYVDHIKKNGMKAIRSVGKRIMEEMKLEPNFDEHIHNSSEGYMMAMQNYSEFIAGVKTQFVVDEEFTFLDMVETASRLIYAEQRKLLDNAAEVLRTIHNENKKLTVSTNARLLIASFRNMSQTIFRQSIKTKRDEMRYICNKYNVCRPYPALTDYLADFLVEIMKLPDHKLDTFMKLMKILAESNQDIFKKISSKEDRDTIATELKEIFKDVYSTQKSLAALRTILIHRFKIIHSPDLKLRMKTQAGRILLDIINKAFEYERDDLISMEFDTTVKAIRIWAIDERLFPESVIRQLLQNILKVLEYNLSKHAKKEVGVLIEAILRGSSKNEELFKTLFRDGSKYVNGEDFHSDLEII